MNSRLTVTVLLAALAACGTADGPAEVDIDGKDKPETPQPTPTPTPELLPEGTLLRSDESRVKDPSVDGQDLRAVVDGNNGFAFTLYEQLSKKDQQDNIFLSPFSISQALAMTYAGARGKTAQQMAATLQFIPDQSKLHAAFNAIDLALASRGQGAQGKDGKGFRLNLINAIWAQRGYPIMQDYLDVLGVNYGAGVYALNFKDQPDPSRQVINEWVADQTEQRIKDLLPAGSILENTRLVLTNAIYFNAAWKQDNVFPEENTADRDFNRPDGSIVQVPTMAHATTFNSGSNPVDGWQAVELPYDGDELSMLVIVPDQGRFDEVEGKLSNALLNDVLGSMSAKYMSLTMPKWKQRSKFQLKDQLEALGMEDAFTSMADFTGINGGVEALWISDVIHEAFVAVDEKGTEAAAATAVVMVGGSAQTDQLKIDRPFIFLIRDIPTNSILFVGRVIDPTK